MPSAESSSGDAASSSGDAASSSREAARHELEVRQRSLVAALVAGAEVPAGVDQARIQAQAAALIAKRARIVARAEPELAAALGSSFRAAFHAYAVSQTEGWPGSSAAEARAFGRYLLGSGEAWLRDGEEAREVRRVARRVAGRRLSWR